MIRGADGLVKIFGPDGRLITNTPNGDQQIDTVF